MKSAIVVMCAGWLALSSAAPSAQGPADGNGRKSEPVRIVRMYGDDHGETHLQTIVLALDSPGARSEILKGPGRVQFARFAADLSSPWHTSDRRKYLVTLSGAGYEIEVTDGTKVKFPAGTILLADDMKSKGHRTRGLGSESLIMYVETDDLPSR